MKIKRDLKNKIVIAVSTLVATIVCLTLQYSQKEKLRIASLSQEIQRSMSYEQFADEDAIVEDTNNHVKFSAFFLRDIDGDGYAEPLKGTCKEIGKQDTLYMELNVITEGRIENAKIEINGQNFLFGTVLPKDRILKNNYIGNDIRKLELNPMNNGTQKMMHGIVRSGNYSSPSRKASAIGNNINNYSRNDNEVVLTGTYINGDNEPTEIRKVIKLTVDWYGTTQAKINNLSQTNNNLDRIIDEENEKISCGFTVQTEETKKELNLYSNYVEGIIPELNGYAPLEVSTTSDNVEFTYNEQERKFTVKRTATADGTGKITKSVGKTNSYGIKVVYPLEAYQSLGEEAVTIKIPVETYYEGYNNPNSEFQNPYKSNVAKDVIVATYRKAIVSPPPGVTIVPAGIDIKVGRYVYNPTSRYIISKEKPLKIYNGVSEEEKDDNYTVRWAISTGTNGQSTGLKLKETKDGETQKVDHFIKTDSTEDSMENVTTNTAIYFSGADKVLEDDGWIKIYDEETGNLLVTLTKETWGKYTSSSPYKYELPVKHIRIETSATKAKSTLYVYNIKTLDDTYITNNYTREQFDNLKYIKSNLAGWLGEKSLGTDTHQALYEAPYCIAEIDISNKTISTQETEKHEIITIKATEDKNSNITGWYNGSFLVKMPAEVLTVDINNVTISNNRVKITSYEVVEIDGSRFIKINTQNNNTDAESYTITIDADITPDPRGVTVSRDIELYASNEMGVDYYYKSKDTFDVNDNLNKLEIINKTSTNISLISPNVLLTNQTLSNYDKIGSTIVSPQIADIAPKYGTVDNDENEATIGIQLINNYTSDISEVILLGRIPFEGNTYVLGEEDLNSSFTTKMKNTGIQIPESLEGKITVYYSEKENTNKEIKNEANEWKKAEDVTDWSKIKTFAIDFEDTVIDPNKEYVFYYTIQVPNGIEFNKIAYSHHGIYFAVHTDEGKYRTSTEPNKLGIRIAEKYDLELTKYQTGKDKKIAGATYSIVEEGQEEGRTATTNSDGTLKIDNLYAERTYIVREIKSPNEYEISNEEIKIIGHIDRENGTLTIEKESGTTRGNIEVTKIEGQNYKVLLNVEDEAKAKLRITKTEQLNGTRIEKVTYKITGEGLPQSGRRLTTNTQGEATISGLKIGAEYTLEETKAEGYYLAEPVKFRISNNEGTYSVEITEGAIKESSITEEESLPTANIVLEDEKIPTYNLELTKIKKVTKLESSEGGESQPNTQEITYLAGAKFRLYKGDEKIGDYISDENGKIEINNLYQYVEGKDFEATYVLKEILPPEGYAKVKDITFKVQRTEGGSLEFKEELAEGQSAKTYTVDDESKTVTVTVEDSPSFKLTKKDGETDQLLANCKFAIYNVDNNQTPATNSKGEIIGERQTINGQEYYVVTTDANGEITADLPEGFYKAVEVEANDEKYDLQGQTYYFGIGASREPKTIMGTEWASNLGGSGNDYIESVKETTDGGYVAVGVYRNTIRILNNEFVSKGNTDGIVIKYNYLGKPEWVNTIGSSGDDDFEDVEIINDGIIAVGNFYGTIHVGDYEFTSKGSNDGIIIKYNSDGEVEYATSLGSGGYDNITSIERTEDGGYIVGGYFNGTIQIGEQQLQSKGNTDGLVIKYKSNGEMEWATSIGGTSADYIYSVAQTKDEGYIIGGYFKGTILAEDQQIQSKGNNDGLVIKYKSNGEIEWADSIGGTSNDYIYSVVQTIDGGYAVGGYFEGTIQIGDNQLESKGNNDGLVIKYKSNGEIEWTDNVGGIKKDFIKTILETQDGKIIAGGYYEGTIQVGEKELNSIGDYDGLIVEYTLNGNVKSATSIGSGSTDQIYSLSETLDGGIIAGGLFGNTLKTGNMQIKSNGGYDGLVLKLKEKEIPTIHTDWADTVGGDSTDQIYSIIETEDGGCAFGGYFSGTIDIGDETITSRKYDGIIIKNRNSKEEWKKIIRGIDYDRIVTIKETTNNDIIVGGYFTGTIQVGEKVLTSNGSTDGIVIKYDKEGNEEWSQSIGGNRDDQILSIIETEDGGIAIGGYYTGTIQVGEKVLTSNGSTDGIIIKYDKEGNVEWSQSIGGNGNDQILSIIETEDGGIAIGGNFTGTNGSTDVIKYDKECSVEWAQSTGGKVTSITETEDGGIAIGGYYTGTIQVGEKVLTCNGNTDGMIIKYDKEGNVELAERIGGIKSDEVRTIAETKDGSILVGGFYNSNTMQVGDVELTNRGDFDGFIAKLTPIYGAADQSELEVKNKRKEYKITTDVQEIDGKKGGSITGEDLASYEIVKYGDTSTKEIKMTPDENYEIIGITVNGEEWPFIPQDDGTYTMPQFENVTEDKHIVVTYSYKDNKITINKVNRDTGEKLPNATFKLDQIDERALPEDAVGNLTDNSKEYDYANKENEVTGVLGTLTDNGDYYFVEQDGKYVPINSKTWQTANVEGATAGVGNTTANSYMELDLTEKTGKYAVVVNAEVSSQSSYDYGYATITESESAPAYNISEGQFMQIAGTQAAKDYTTFLDGGKKYYLHLGYRKNASTDTNQDQVIINSINVYGATVEYYNFASNEGKYESTNQGKDSTISNSYIPINLDNREGKYNLTVNAEISSQSSDYGYATITETPERVANTVSTGRFINISGTKAAQDYTTVLEGGKTYYLHLGYYKNASTSTGDDKFTVNSVEVTLNDSELYHTEVTTNSEGQAITQIPFGKYMVTEISAPDGYIVNEAIPDIEFRADGVHEFTIEDEEKAKVMVHHYEAIENEDSTITYTENKLAEDELQEDKIGEDYTTSPNMNIRRFSLLKNTSGDYVIPDNATGTFTEDDQEVNYYYTKSSIPLIVHHYIEGTENPVPLKGGEEAEDTSDSGEEGEKYITTEISSEELASNYELIEVPENNEGTYEGDEVIVTYYYREIKRGLTLIKYDEDGETPLGGATFEITTTETDIENGEEVERTISLGEYTTDEQGQINITTGVGEYIIKETHAPDGYKLDETDYSVIITRDTQEAKIEIPNEKKRGTVIVHYYLQEDDGTPTTTPIKLTDGNNAEDLVKIGIVGDTYVTKPHEDAAEYYELVSETPVYSSGEYIDGDIEVTYYYKEKKFEYTVEYYYDNVRDDSKTEEKEAKYGDEITTYTDKVIEGYKFEKKENLPLTISSNPEENVIKIYYVKRNDLQYIVNYLEKGTENVLHKTKTVENKKFQDVINSTDEVISIYGYDYDSADKEGITLQIDSSKNVINLYYTKKDTSLVVKYVDVNTNEEIAIADRSTGKVGDEYRTTNKIITGYVYLADRAPENANGTLKEEETTVTYYYVKNTKVIVKYIDKITGDELTREITIEGKQGDPYTTVQREFNNYELVEVTGAREGEMAADTIEVIYYYVHNSAGVEVNYLDANTNEPLAEQDILEGKEGDRYTTRPKAYVEGDEATARLKGYELVESRYPDNSEGEMTINKIVVNYYYAKKTNVIVKYKDINTGEDIITPITIPGHDGDDYETEEKDFDNYVLVERPTNKEGKMLEEPIEVIYYYAHISAGVIEKHFDEFTGELLDSKTYEGKEGDRYTTSSKTFNGYELDEEKLPSNATGTMTQDVIEVDYYYRYKTNVVARYIDKITEALLTENVSKDGYEGEKYNTERKTFEGYELVEVPENADGNMTRDTIIVTYYYVNTSAGVKVNHYDIITGEKIVREETIKGKVGDDYTTSEKELENYDIVEERYPLNREGTMTSEEIKVDYYYIHKAKVTTKYIDKVTGEELTTPITVPGHEGDPYKTEEKTFENYKLEEVPTNKEGTMTKEDIEVIYYYVRESAGVKVNHYDVVTGEKIIDEETISGYEGDIYETKEKSYEEDDEKTKEFKDYDLVEEKYPENATGTMTKEVAYVDYYYIKKSTVRVKYVDKATGEELTEDIIIEGHEGEEYETEEKQFEDYDIVEDKYPENTKGTIEKEEKQVIYYYKKKTKVKSEYIDKETNEKIETDEEIEGHEGDSYKTLEKKIEYYDLIEKPENSTGDMTKEEIKVKYYYKKKIFNLGIDKKVKATIRNGERREVNKDSAKQEIYSSQVSKTSIKAEYSIVVTNKGEIAGTAKIEENIPEGMKMLQEENKDWTIMGNTAILTTEEIQPGSSKEYVVTLTWDNNKSNYGVRENIVRIVEVTNKAKYSETDLTDNESKATFAITVPTGIKEYGKISGIVLIILITVAGEIVAIKKKNNQ